MEKLELIILYLNTKIGTKELFLGKNNTRKTEKCTWL